MTCTCCQTPLTGGTDTFGQVGLEMCQSCWWALPYDGDVILEQIIKHARSEEWAKEMQRQKEQSS